MDVLRQSMLVEISEANNKIRRNPEVPLPEGNSEDRTVYIKGFNRSDTKIEQLIEFFKKYEGFEAVVMRYYKEKVLVCTPKEAANTNGNSTSEEPKKPEEGSEATPEEKTDSSGEQKVGKADSAQEGKKEESKPAVPAKMVQTEDKIVWQKKFKGSIFVVFKTVEQATKLAEEEEFSYPGNQAPVSFL